MAAFDRPPLPRARRWSDAKARREGSRGAPSGAKKNCSGSWARASHVVRVREVRVSSWQKQLSPGPAATRCQDC
jgi:hypothetical protein